MYIHQNKNWPDFIWDGDKLSQLLAEVRHKQGRLLGRMEGIGFKLREEANLQTLTIEIVKSNEIEGEILNQDQVRSSIARRLGMDIGALVPASRDVDGVVEMMLDATQKFDTPLTDKRLFGWHAAIFPTGHSGMFKITVANWRDNKSGPMQVVSGPVGREKVHYQAPEAEMLERDMNNFLTWFNQEIAIDPVLKAAIAHLWFVTVHPFDDGNGRIARAVADMQLARADRNPQRFYSMSAQIELEKNDHYNILEQTQKGTLDITDWLEWFLNCLDRSIVNADATLSAIFKKAIFWGSISNIPLNPRQHFMTNKLFDDFFGKLTTSKWAKMNKCSTDTALRDIQDLVEKGILIKEESGGRSTNYVINSRNA
jgi:Fic family protein